MLRIYRNKGSFDFLIAEKRFDIFLKSSLYLIRPFVSISFNKSLPNNRFTSSIYSMIVRAKIRQYSIFSYFLFVRTVLPSNMFKSVCTIVENKHMLNKLLYIVRFSLLNNGCVIKCMIVAYSYDKPRV